MREDSRRQQVQRQDSRQNARQEDRRREYRTQNQSRELTPEERRRRQILKKQRARQHRRARIRRFLLVAVLLVVIVIVLPKAIRWGYDTTIGAYDKIQDLLNKDEDKDSVQTGGNAAQDPDSPSQIFTFGGVDREVMDILEERYEGDDQAKDILKRSGQYPDELLTLLSKRPETLDFVLQYPEYKDLAEPQVDLSGEVKAGTIPRLYQWDLRWGYGRYGENIIALAGCGPTCLSMVMLGLTGDAQWDPVEIARFSETKGYVSQVGTSWELMSVGAQELGLTSQELPLDENRMIRELEEGHPIICSMRPGDFTDTGHFIVLVGYENGGFVVHDPNSIDNSDKTWNYEEIRGQIRNLWAFSLP